jgi:hypothetical protein
LPFNKQQQQERNMNFYMRREMPTTIQEGLEKQLRWKARREINRAAIKSLVVFDSENLLLHKSDIVIEQH